MTINILSPLLLYSHQTHFSVSLCITFHLLPPSLERYSYRHYHFLDSITSISTSCNPTYILNSTPSSRICVVVELPIDSQFRLLKRFIFLWCHHSHIRLNNMETYLPWISWLLLLFFRFLSVTSVITSRIVMETNLSSGYEESQNNKHPSITSSSDCMCMLKSIITLYILDEMVDEVLLRGGIREGSIHFEWMAQWFKEGKCL